MQSSGKEGGLALSLLLLLLELLQLRSSHVAIAHQLLGREIALTLLLHQLVLPPHHLHLLLHLHQAARASSLPLLP
jgi:hypothetical protein